MGVSGWHGEQVTTHSHARKQGSRQRGSIKRPRRLAAMSLAVRTSSNNQVTKSDTWSAAQATAPPAQLLTTSASSGRWSSQYAWQQPSQRNSMPPTACTWQVVSRE